MVLHCYFNLYLKFAFTGQASVHIFTGYWYLFFCELFVYNLWKKALRNALFSRMGLAKGRATRKELFTLT